MKKKLILFVLAMALLSVSVTSLACTKTENQKIKDTVVGFLDAYNKAQYNRCLDFFSTKARAREGDLLVRLRAGRNVTGDISYEDVGEPVITGSTATISVTMISYNLGAQPTKFSLVKENDEWKLAQY